MDEANLLTRRTITSAMGNEQNPPFEDLTVDTSPLLNNKNTSAAPPSSSQSMHFIVSQPIVVSHEELGERIKVLDELTEKQAYIEGRMMINEERIAKLGRKASRMDRAKRMKMKEMTPRKKHASGKDKEEEYNEGDNIDEDENEEDDGEEGYDEEEVEGQGKGNNSKENKFEPFSYSAEEIQGWERERERAGHGIDAFCERFEEAITHNTALVERWGRRIARNELRIQWIEEELRREEEAARQNARKEAEEVYSLRLLRSRDIY